ncbi:MAG: DEAD/DEAH box helicase [Methanobacteriota archaeon]|nr:MAG: DEAD/DEAH box helicase [Euryarchaeota archaeon]
MIFNTEKSLGKSHNRNFLRWVMTRGGKLLGYYNAPNIKKDKIENRIYQQILFAAGAQENSLIVLPTGLGKTIVVVMLMAYFLDRHPDSQVVFTAPTKPLVDQHRKTISDLLDVSPERIVTLSGAIPPQLRKQYWEKGQIIILTPQVLKNDIISGTCNLKKISFLCIDETHRLVGDDASVIAVEQYRKQNPKGRVVGITASPGRKEKIREIVRNLGATRIEFLDEDHPAVKPFVHTVKEEYVKVDLPEEFDTILTILKDLVGKFLKNLKEMGLITSHSLQKNNKKDLLQLNAIIDQKRQELDDDSYFAAKAAYGHTIRLLHAIEVLETQGIPTLYAYLKKQKESAEISGKRSIKKFFALPGMDEVWEKTEDLYLSGYVHPKLEKLNEIVKEELEREVSSRILVFSNYRDTVKQLTDQLNKIDGVEAHWFVGQKSSKEDLGLRQKDQIRILEQFKQGYYNVLVSTSVGEEGLDVAQCDLVVFYDVVPSEIRAIQRSGRTGRKREGKVIILAAKNTRDEGFYWASRAKRSQLNDVIAEVKNELEGQKQKNLDDFFDSSDPVKEPAKLESPPDPPRDPTKPTVYVDNREKGSSIVRALLNQEINIIPQTLPIGDYILSNRVAIERKTTEDFAKTLMRQDLFTQISKLKDTYERPLLIVEGEDLYTQSISKNAVQGAISSIIIDYQIPVIFTKNPDETAEYIYRIAYREQILERRPATVKTMVKPSSLAEEQLRLVSQIPKINTKIATNLLREFGTIRNIFNQDQDSLRKVKGIGQKLANHIDLLVNTPFEEND